MLTFYLIIPYIGGRMVKVPNSRLERPAGRWFGTDATTVSSHHHQHAKHYKAMFQVPSGTDRL